VSAITPIAIRQTNLGAVLDAGGRQLSADQFKRDVVGKVISSGSIMVPYYGSVTGSGRLELVYLSAGGIRGSAQRIGMGGASMVGGTIEVDGSWTIDERERVCTTMRMGATVLAPRCPF
jgi:hypothetical protein